MSSELVTVGIPVYNGANRLRRSIESVLTQDYPNLEIIVSDNGSTDGTLDLVRRLTSGDDRVRIFGASTNRGAAWNYNNVLKHASGEYFRWHADDDWFEPGLISRLVGALSAEPKAILSHSWTRFVDEEGETLRVFEDDLGVVGDTPHHRLESVIRHLTYCNPVFGLIRRDVLERTARIAPFPESDVALLYELALAGTFAVVPEALFVRRPGNSIKSNPTNAQLAEWFSPDHSGSRFPSLRIYTATVGATHRLDLPLGERLRVIGTLSRIFPKERARRLNSRRRRRRSSTSSPST